MGTGCFLPDVSVYGDLCQILGITIHEFLAGEDIPQECIIPKSEENIIGVATDSKKKQSRLKVIICVLLVVTFLAMCVIGIAVYFEIRPKNQIAPIDRNSIEMRTAELLAGPEGAYIYRFDTTDEYERLKLFLSEYHSGKLLSREVVMELGFEGIGSPESGEILIVPDFENYEVKLVIAAEGAKASTEISILDGVADKKYYGRSASEIQEATEIRYDEEQALVALIYDNDEMWVVDLCDLIDGPTNSLAKNDYVYYFSVSFCKK